MICRECNNKIMNLKYKKIECHPNWGFQDTFICNNCLEKLNLIECEACHDFINIDKTTTFHGKHICDTCSNITSFCDNCKNVVYQYDTIYNETIDGIICRDCFKTLNCYFCPICNCVRSGGDNCCEDVIEFKSNQVMPYNFKPDPIFFKLTSKNKPLFFGVELEIGGAPSIENVNNLINDDNGELFYFKQDGSIPTYGVEIVTHPATLEFHESKKSGWRKLLSKAIKEQLRGFEHHDCGIHIHVNRDYFEKNDFAKIDLFVNNYERFFRKLSRRHTSFAEFIRNKPKVLIGKFNGVRFSAVNFANENTIEFRMFRSTMKYSALMSTIELTHAICNFVKNNEFNLFLEEKNETISDFVSFIIQNEYKYLLEFLVNNNIVEINEDEVTLKDNLMTNKK